MMGTLLSFTCGIRVYILRPRMSAPIFLSSHSVRAFYDIGFVFPSICSPLHPFFIDIVPSPTFSSPSPPVLPSTFAFCRTGLSKAQPLWLLRIAMHIFLTLIFFPLRDAVC